MQCPHCLEYFDRKPLADKVGRDEPPDEDHQTFGGDPQQPELYGYGVVSVNCTACGRLIIQLVQAAVGVSRNSWYLFGQQSTRWVLPASPSRMRFAADIPDEFRRDYGEAVAVLPFSAAASAALSRRCLQNIVRHKAGITRKNLYLEIEELLQSAALPSYLQKVLHPVRELGNVAAHPIKLEVTSQVVPVEAGEAEFCLNAIEKLLDFYCVQPRLAEESLDRVNRKLKEVRGSDPLES